MVRFRRVGFTHAELTNKRLSKIRPKALPQMGYRFRATHNRVNSASRRNREAGR